MLASRTSVGRTSLSWQFIVLYRLCSTQNHGNNGDKDLHGCLLPASRGCQPVCSSPGTQFLMSFTYSHFPSQPSEMITFFFFFWPFKRKLRFRRGGGSTFNESFIDLRVQESWEGIPVHQGVDLQLGIFVHVRAGVQQVPVDHLPNSRIQADLKRNKTRYVRVVCK